MLGKRLENVSFDEYYCSELNRAKETLNACLKFNVDYQNKIKNSKTNNTNDNKKQDSNTQNSDELTIDSNTIESKVQDESLIKIEKRLNERDSGVIEGHSWGTINKISEVSYKNRIIQIR